MMKIRLLVLVFCVLCTTGGFAQQKYIEELKSIIQQNKQDSAHALAYNRLVFMGEDYGFPQTDSIVEKALQVSRRSNSNAQTAFALLNKSLVLAKSGKYDTALYTANQAWGLLLKTDTLKNSEVLSVYYFTKGNILLPQGSFKEETLAGFLKALELSKKASSKYLVSVCYGGVVTAYNYLRQFDHSIQINKEFLSYASKVPVDTLLLAKAYNNLGAAYINSGDKKTAAQYFSNFEQLLPGLKSHYMNYLFISNKAHRLMEDGKYKEAIQIALQAIDISRKNNISSLNKLSSYYLLGYIYYLNNDFKKAMLYLDTTYTIASETGSAEYIMYAASGMAEIEGKLGNYKSAAEYLTLQMNLSDSISNVKSKINANFLNIQYQTAQKEAQINLQQASIRQKNTLNYILIGSAASLLVISLLGYRNYRNKQKLQQQRITELETEKQLTATEAVLKGEEQERTRLAKDLHDGLGGMLSGIKYSLNTMKGNLVMTPDNAQAFERSMDMLDSSIKEMRRVAHNMMPEALVKFGLDTALKDFCNDINQSGALKLSYQSIGLKDTVIEQTTAIAICRIVQELLNNTMKHSAATNAIVQVSKMDDLLSVTVEDDGKGFDASILEKSKGIGWENIKNRVEFLKGKLDVNSQSGKGTSVHIEFNA